MQLHVANTHQYGFQFFYQQGHIFQAQSHTYVHMVCVCIFSGYVAKKFQFDLIANNKYEVCSYVS